MENKLATILGMVWYRQDDYPRILAVMEDANRLPITWHSWLMQAETGEKRLRRDGHRTIRVIIEPEPFAAWCRENGYRINAEARNHFANIAAHREATGGNQH